MRCILLLLCFIVQLLAFREYPIPSNVGGLYWHITADCATTSLSCPLQDEKVLFKLWISDTFSPLIDTSTPTEMSYFITSELRHLGEFPSLSLSYQSFINVPLHTPVQWNASEGVFTFTLQVPESPERLIISVQSFGVSIFNRFVQNQSFYFTFSPMEVTGSIPSDGVVDSKLIMDPRTSIVCLFNQPTNQLVLSSSGFNQSEVIDLNIEIPNHYELKDVVFKDSKTVLFTTNYGFLEFDLYSSLYTDKFNDENLSRFSKIFRSSSHNEDFIVAFAENSLEFMVYDPFLIDTVPVGDLFDDVIDLSDYVISDLVIVQSKRLITFLFQSSNDCFVVLYHYAYQSFSKSNFKNQPINSNLKFVHTNLITPDVLLINGNSLSYSPNGGLTFLDFDFDDVIANTALSQTGRILIILENGDVFVGGLGFSDFFIVFDLSILNPLASHVFSLYRGEFVVVDHNDVSNPILIDSDDVISNQIMSPCPFIDLVSDLQPIYHLDIGESFNISGSLIGILDISNMITSESLFLTASLSDSQLIAVEFYRSFRYLGPTLFESSLSITIDEGQVASYQSFSDRVKYGQGVSTIKFQTSIDSFACNAFVFTSVYVGCPPNRNLGVQEVFESQMNYDLARQQCPEYDVDGSSRFFVVNGEEFEYDLKNWGCPIEVYHGTSGFLPELVLFDELEEVKDVEVDYVISELFNRTDWTYSSTFSEVGCSGDLVLDDSNTPSSYTNCFKSNTSLSNPNDLYYVLNSTGLSQIRFPKDGNDGFFLFKVKVIAPHYSYCELETIFVIKVFGSPLPTVWSVLVIGICFFVMILVFFSSYSIYKKQKVA
ncbi:hypothetical protein P9112_004468 [Eukaryota sp. TZLM1-RC]